MSSSLASSLWIFLTACGTILAILLTTKKNPIRRIIVTILAKIQFQWQIARCSQNSNNNNSNSSHDKLAADTSTSCTGGAAVVTGLFVHPVKSLKAVPVETATIGPRGFVGDREYMLVIPASKPLYIIRDDDDDATTTHRFITQRHCPSLARVHVRSITTTIDNEKNTTNSDTIQNALQFTTDILPDTTLTIPTRPLPDAPVYRSTIWGDIVQVQDMGDDAAAFFRSILAQDKESQVTLAENASQVRLVRQMDTDQRTANDKFVPPAARRTIVWGSSSNPPVALADGFPILIASESSLAELNRRLKEKGKTALPMARFRPNIIIRGGIELYPFAEDRMKLIRIGTTIFHVVSTCARCKESCTDQTTGQVTSEPVETMSEFRRTNRLCPEAVYFAVNAIPAIGSETNTIAMGDKVQVLQWGDPVWGDP